LSTDRRFFGHPLGLSVLFFAELWERFSYYGMRALLILYLTASIADGGLAFDAGKATAIYALYVSSVYLLGLPGGWIADRILGQQRSVLIGGILITLGHFSMAVSLLPFFYVGLCLIALGTGMLKPNISTIVGQLYESDDNRRDAGFSIFYMGINIGALGGPLICSWLGENVDWHMGFAAAGVGMVLGLLVYLRFGNSLGDAGRYPANHGDVEASAQSRRMLRRSAFATLGAIFGLILFLRLSGMSIDAENISNGFGILLILLCIVFFFWLFRSHPWTAEERGRLGAIVVLFFAAAFFWGAYEQAGSSLNLFARDLTQRTLLGWHMPAGYFQTVPALFVIIQAPIFAWLWVRLGARQPTSPAKFVLGLIFVGLGFVVMAGASMRASADQPVSPLWLIATYFLHVVGEMCLSPVGLSTVTKLAPDRVASLMMGVWFLAAAVGNYVGGRAAGAYETMSLSSFFGIVAAVSIGAGLVLGLMSGKIKRMMGGIH
jgi:POT family proton-dependent oligopeptide transporter